MAINRKSRAVCAVNRSCLRVPVALLVAMVSSFLAGSVSRATESGPTLLYFQSDALSPTPPPPTPQHITTLTSMASDNCLGGGHYNPATEIMFPFNTNEFWELTGSEFTYQYWAALIVPSGGVFGFPSQVGLKIIMIDGLDDSIYAECMGLTVSGCFEPFTYCPVNECFGPGSVCTNSSGFATLMGSGGCVIRYKRHYSGPGFGPLDDSSQVNGDMGGLRAFLSPGTLVNAQLGMASGAYPKTVDISSHEDGSWIGFPYRRVPSNLYPLPQDASGWYQTRGTAKLDGFAPVALPLELNLAWTRTEAGAGIPVVSGSRIVYSRLSVGRVAVHRAEDGEVIWSATPGGLSSIQAAISDGLVLVGGTDLIGPYDPGYAAYDSGTGLVMWSTQDSSGAAEVSNYSLALGRGLTIFTRSQNGVGELHSNQTGLPVFSPTGGGASGVFIGVTPGSRPVIHNGDVFVSGPINGYNGGWEVLTRLQVDEDLGLHPKGIAFVTPGTGAAVASDGEMLLCLSGDGRSIRRVDVDGVVNVGTVAIQWTASDVGRVARDGIAVGAGRIAALSALDQRLTILDLNSGAIPTSGTLYLSAQLGATPTTGVSMTDNAVLFGDSQGRVHVYDPTTLQERQLITVSTSAIIGELAVTETGVFGAAADGTIFRLGNQACVGRSFGYPQNGHQAIGPGGVNTVSGNMIFTVQDVSLPFAGLSINFLRTYNSARAKPSDKFGDTFAVTGTAFVSAMGPGWTHSYQVAIRPQFDSVSGATLWVEERGDGRELAYTETLTGRIVNPQGITDLFITHTVTGSAFSATVTGRGFCIRKKHGLRRDFDMDGNLIRMLDPSGNFLHLTYTQVGAEARPLTVVYGSSTALAELQSSCSSTLEAQLFGGGLGAGAVFTATVFLDYNAQGRLTGLKYPTPDGSGLTELVYEYNGDGLLVKASGPTGGTIYAATYAYDTDGRMTEKKEPRAPAGEKWLKFTYDLDGRTVGVRAGQTNSKIAGFDYVGAFDDALHTVVSRPTKTVEALTTYVYDACRLLREVRDPTGGITRYGWDASLNQVSMTDANGNSTSWYYDSKGNVTLARDAVGSTVFYEYEPTFNQISRKLDANTSETLFTYDVFGNLSQSTQKVKALSALGESATDYITRHGYENRGLRISTTDAGSSETYFEYNARGDMTAVGQRLNLVPSGSTVFITRFTYDQLGRRIEQQDPKGTITKYTYDLENRLTQVTYGGDLSSTTILGRVTYEYDAMNRLTKETDLEGRFTAYTYDERDRLTEVENALGDTTVHEYDGSGNRTKTADPNNNATEFDYDLSGRLIGVTDAEGGTAAYTYDAVGNLKEVTDPNGNITRYDYDILNRLTKVTHPDNTDEEFTYDAVGNRLTRTDGRNVTASYLYDSLNQMRRVQYSDSTPESKFYFDPNGNRTKAETTVNSKAWVEETDFDSLSRPTEERMKSDGSILAEKTFTYDEVGNRLTMVVDAPTTGVEDHAMAYTYDRLSRVGSVAHRNLQTTYVYDGSGNLKSAQLPNRVKTTYAYDQASRLLKLRHARQPSQTALSFFEYTYDNMNNRLSMRDTLGLHSYGYDKLYRLKTVNYPASPDQTYTYDPAGNRLTLALTGETTRSYTYNTTNALTKATAGAITQDYTWDAAGNLGTRTTDDGGGEDVVTYAFDGVNRLTQVSSSTTTVTYSYDHDGQRVYEKAQGKETWFVFDGLSVVMELDSTKTPKTVIVPGISKTDLTSATPLTEWYLHDGLGSVAMLTDFLGNPTQTYRYDVFGADQNGHADPMNRYRFVGLAHDDLTGLTYMNARWYDPIIGRFLSRDPLVGSLGFQQSLNRYSYVQNSPTNQTDPTGLFAPAIAVPVAYVAAAAAVVVYVAAKADIPAGIEAAKEMARQVAEAASNAVAAVREAISSHKDGEETSENKEGTQTTPAPAATAPTDGGETTNPPPPPSEDSGDKKDKRKYSPHAERQMKKRGVSRESVEEAIEKGKPSPGNKGDRTVHDLPASQSTSGRAVRVVTENKDGEVVTVIDKGSQ